MNISMLETLSWKFLKSALPLALVALLVVSCGDVSVNSPEETGPEAQFAHMNIHLTDAPADYQQVNVDVQGLRIHYTPSSSDTSDTTTTEGEWVDLPVEPMQVNLLELTNGADTLLASADLDPGHYRELRLLLGSDNTVMVDSTTHNLKVPSGQQSGYKIKFDADLEAGEEIDLTIDFDAARSLHRAGNSGKYILRPVLRAYAETSDTLEAGSIHGMIEPLEAQPDIFAIMNDDTTSTQPDDQGEFLLEALPVGQYDLLIAPTDTQYADTTLSDIMVEDDQQTDVGTITLSSDGSE